MATAITKQSVFGDMRVVIGTFLASGSSATIETGLKKIEIFLHENATTANADLATISGGTVTLTTAGATDEGRWIAVGV